MTPEQLFEDYWNNSPMRVCLDLRLDEKQCELVKTAVKIAFINGFIQAKRHDNKV